MCYELGNGTKDLSFSNRILSIVASSTMKPFAFVLFFCWANDASHIIMATLYRVSDNYNTFINGFMLYMFFFVPL